MTSRSNTFCPWTGAASKHAKRATTAVYKADSRKSPTFRSVKMDSDHMDDGGCYEKKEQGHMQHMPQRE